jgi:hypothetical protein
VDVEHQARDLAVGGWNPWRCTPQDLDVTEGGPETVKGRELGRDRLRQATKLPMAQDLDVSVGW